MRRINIAGLAIIAVLAVSSGAADTASAKRLILSEGGVALPAGRAFTVFNRDNLIIRTSEENIECIIENPLFEEGAGLGVEVVTNSRPTDRLRVTNGVGLFGGAVRPVCNTFTPTFGRAQLFLQSSGLLSLTSKGEASEPGMLFLIRFERGPEECYYQGAFSGVVNATPTRQRLGIEYGGRLLRDEALSPDERCPTFIETTVGYSLNRSQGAEEEVENQVEAQT